MKRNFLHTIFLNLLIATVLSAGLPSCVTPNEIEILGDNQWSVYGIIGEDNTPVIFVYKVIGTSSFEYNSAADIILEHKATGLSTLLVPVIAGDELNYNVNEFPFGEDWSGHIIYYTTPQNLPLPGGDYEVGIDLGKDRGFSEITLPESVEFSSVEIRTTVNDNGNEVDRVYMSIDDIGGDDIYKWEISIDQVILVQIPVEYDSVSGNPTVFEETPILFSQVITPNNYITQSKIEENGNEFRYNLSANFPDFPYTTEAYRINVRLRHYSDDLLSYFTSIAEQQAGEVFDPFIEPVFIRSNIDGLTGVIGTYAYSQDYILEYQP